MKPLITKKLSDNKFGCVQIEEYNGRYSVVAFVADSKGNALDAWYDVEDALRIDGQRVSFVTESAAEGWFVDKGLLHLKRHV